MSCYIIKPSVASSEIGSAFPQVQKMPPGYNFKSYNSVHVLSMSSQSFPNFYPNLDYFIVHKKAN